MLYVTWEGPGNAVSAIDSTFMLRKEKDWFNDDFIKRVIKGIDKCIHYKDEYVESPIWGGMSVDRLSSGCKAVILMAKTDLNIYATKCGDNCGPFIYEISQMKDLYITVHHYLRFGDPKDFKAVITNNGKIVNSEEEYIYELMKLKGVIKDFEFDDATKKLIDDFAEKHKERNSIDKINTF